MPVVGHLAVGSPNKPFIAALHQGLKEGGYVEGQSIAFEYRFANGQYDRLPALAAELVARGVTVIFTEGGSLSALAAKQATTTIPILGGGDPVQDGLVTNISRPEANLTGVLCTALHWDRRSSNLCASLFRSPV
jgi:putative ABC transport system substrate-binding protein